MHPPGRRNKNTIISTFPSISLRPPPRAHVMSRAPFPCASKTIFPMALLVSRSLINNKSVNRKSFSLSHSKRGISVSTIQQSSSQRGRGQRSRSQRAHFTTVSSASFSSLSLSLSADQPFAPERRALAKRNHSILSSALLTSPKPSPR